MPRTPSGNAHRVRTTKMLRELDQDTRETLARCFQYRLLNQWTEDQDMMWARQLVTMVKKKNGKLTMKGFRPIAMLTTMCRLYSKMLQTVGGPGNPYQVRTAVRSCSWPSSPGGGLHPAQTGGASKRVADTYIRDGLQRCAAFDHVSHHLIVDAMEALKVPPVLVSAWTREYRSSETHIKLDDTFTPGIRRTCSVPQGAPCAANLFGAPWMCQLQLFV